MNLVRTKICVPPMLREHVERPRLTSLFNAGLKARLTLVSAPAGFGKTTAVCEWLGTLDLPVAWLSLNEEDDSWPRFLTYLLASLQTLDPQFATGLLGALESPRAPDLDNLLGALPSELATLRRPFVLVLDDFHAVGDSQVQEVVTFIVDNQPPGMHIVLVGRTDPPWPLGRLRSTGALLEVRASDLRFTLEEATRLMNETLELGISREDLSVLEERTDGWVTGLHLAALSLRNTGDRHGFIQAFAGSDRFVLDFLMEEVLAQQPEDVARFLLQTSLLDRFSAGLCDFALRQYGSQEMLRRMEAANLFVVPLDRERLWFAYHPLMRSFLRSVQRQRDPAGAKELHVRASQWYEARGDAVDAIQHALVAGDLEAVGRLLRSHALALVFQGELSPLLNWLHAYSETWLRAGPWLRIAQLWAHSFSGEAPTMGEELAETRELIHVGLRALEGDSDVANIAGLQHALAHLTAIEANLAVMDGRHLEAVRLSQRALVGLPIGDPTARRYAHVCLGMALRHLGRLSEAIEALTQADSPGQKDESGAAPARGLATMAGIQIWMGDLGAAESTCRRLISLHDEHLRRCGRRLPVAAFGYARLSDICLQRNQVGEALRLAQEARSLADQWQQTDALFESYSHLARALWASGDPAAASGLLRRLEHLVRDRSPWLHEMTCTEEARLWLACAEDATCLERVRTWALDHPLPADRRLVFHDHLQYITHAGLLLVESRRDRSRAKDGLALTVQLLDLLEASGALGLALQVSALRCLFEAESGLTREALLRLQDSLRRAEPPGYIRLFTDHGAPMEVLLAKVPASEASYPFAQELRRAFASGETLIRDGSRQAATSDHLALAEPLSERERDVLRLLGSSLSSAEIADQLCVATSTVRSHTKAIYGKLGVHTRLEAIELARELGFT